MKAHLEHISLVCTTKMAADEIAITIGLLSTIEGIIKVHRSGESTTFTGMFASFAW
jgi:hypothetical protein